MESLSRYELESLAAQILSDYRRLPGAASGPVDPVRLLRELLGLTLDMGQLSRDGSILGVTAFSPIGVEVLERGRPEVYLLDGRTVLVDSRITNRGRFRFTVAHEGCHHVLYRLFPETSGFHARRALCCREAEYSPETAQVERLTDRLAAALLMPEAVLRRALEEAGFPKGFRKLSTACCRTEYWVFGNLCRQLGVSRQALACRLETLGLVQINRVSGRCATKENWMEDGYIGK